MKSPFPGMDPYLEDPAFWPDFHPRFITYWCDYLSDSLPEPYEARLNERVHLVAMSLDVRETHIEILHRPDHALVAVLELLSPWNKSGDGYLQYLVKRKAVLRQKVHLVELDLLVGGQRVQLAKPLPAGDYYGLVSRGGKPDCEVYAWSVRDALPAIPLPLQAPDPDLPMAVGAVFATAYKLGRYGRSLKYGTAPLAPLRKKDRAWAMRFGVQVDKS